MHEEKRVTEGLPVTSVLIKQTDMAKTPKMDVAAATEEGAGVAPGTAGSADSHGPSGIDKDGFMKNSHQRKSREDKGMMATFIGYSR
eukprot:6377664-Pyramimonas_sp.AAC.1